MAAKKERAASPKATPRKPRKAAPAGVAGNARVEISPDELKKLISEAAYYRAKERGFAPGREMEDWIEAEAEVRKRLGA